ncbi:MAG: FecR domain-containing protein [Candidatus Eremiobacteraeota bacterium]|nr:FecR domain-containing protein [Candidatus Eremiobacteraeota bacterium]MCW5869347.1 FecR domain-containing protein [Candidatus Eremiobacteraeota bacterium]
MKRALLIFALALPAPAEEPVLRVQSIQAVDPKGQTQLLQKRPEEAKGYPVTINATGYVQDHFATSSNTMAALEFLIGGRVGINQSTDVEVLNERAVGDAPIPVKRIVLKNGSIWVKADAKTLKQPLEIQTNGGVMGIRGTEFTVHEEEDGTVEVNCFESNSEQGGVEIRDLTGQVVGTARPGDQVRLHRSRRPVFRRFQNIAQYRQQILTSRRFQALGRNAYFNKRFLGGLGAMPGAELAHAYFRAQQHRQLERNPHAAHPRRRLTFPSRLTPDANDPGQSAVGHHPRFSWLGVARANGYLVTISRDEAGEENLFTQRVKATRTSYPLFMRPLPSGRYYWRVTPVDAQDNPILEASQTTFDVQ